MKDKIKVVNILPHPPGYNYFPQTPPPSVSWNTENGDWVGIWDTEWPDLVGSEISKLSNDFIYEVWQPDPKAKKIYSCTWYNGVIHKLFPTEIRHKRLGIKYIAELYSLEICQRLFNEIERKRIILHLNDLGFKINQKLISLFQNRIPILVQFLGENDFLFVRLLKFRKDIIAMIYEWHNFYYIKKLLKKTDAISYCNYRTYHSLKKEFADRLYFLPMGIDFNFWKPIYSKESAKKILGLKDTKFVLFTSSRLIRIKQIDRVIKILEKLGDYFDFQYIVAGIGDPDYTKYLFTVGERLIAKGKLKFTGYLSDELLRTYYNAADIFLSPSSTEGMPVTALKAVAMDLPILCTKTGLLSDLLLKHNCGTIASLDTWPDILKKFFEGKIEIPRLKRDIITALFDWPRVAQRYIKLYKELIEKKYG